MDLDFLEAVASIGGKSQIYWNVNPSFSTQGYTSIRSNVISM